MRKLSELEHFFIDGVMLNVQNFQIHWNIIGSRLKIYLKFIVQQFRQFCDTLKICLKFIVEQLQTVL